MQHLPFVPVSALLFSSINEQIRQYRRSHLIALLQPCGIGGSAGHETGRGTLSQTTITPTPDFVVQPDPSRRRPRLDMAVLDPSDRSAVSEGRAAPIFVNPHEAEPMRPVATISPNTDMMLSCHVSGTRSFDFGRINGSTDKGRWILMNDVAHTVASMNALSECVTTP